MQKWLIHLFGFVLFLSGSICVVVFNLQFRNIVVFHPHYYAVCVYLFGNFRILVPVIFGSTRLEFVFLFFCFRDASVL